MSAVLESALPARLKPYAAAFASFAAPDGSRVFPSVRRVAQHVGRSTRQTKVAIARLKRLGVLELARPHTPRRPAEYRFMATALPQLGDPQQLPLGWHEPLTSLAQPRRAQRNGEKPSAKRGFPQFPQALTGRWPHLRGEASLTRSVSDPSVRTRTRARAKSGQTPKRAYG